MSAMYPTMTSGKVDKFLVNPGDKVVQGMAVCEIISEGYFTLLSEVNGRVNEYYVSEGEYVEVDAPLMSITLAENDDG
jgi:pyruvate/2-oxoglutarate dehydrogenase complex dihydrolipoamide acyltransferase (E2) component